MPSPGLALARRLGLDFRDEALLEQALVHSSFVNEHPESALPSNERLEFLGDAVVSLIFSEALWIGHPDEPEGGLTTRRATIVSTRGLARIAARLDLGSALQMGQGAERSGERRRASVLAGSLEALVAALYLDQGIEVTRQRLYEWAAPELEAPKGSLAPKPPKSRLQEHSFATTNRAPVYSLVSADGPDHSKHYVVDVSIAGQHLSRGSGRSRRDAETEAARAALELLPPPAEP
ncbi:MAG: ribonuclease III [Chloroflexota bacterium]|nr:ribonuclease III [Chloroflexota bacterium]